MASFPNEIKTFTTKVNNVDTVFASHINDLQDEIVAIETKLGTNLSTVGSLVFIDNTGNMSALGTDLVWDSTNNRLGIKTSSPDQALDVRGHVQIKINEPNLIFHDTGGGGTIARLKFYQDDVQHAEINYNVAVERFSIVDSVAAVTRFTIEPDTGFMSHITPADTNAIIGASVDGDTRSRFSITVKGIMQWGDGTNVADVNLYRSQAGRLKTDDAFQAIGGLVTSGGAAGITYSGSISNLSIVDGIVTAQY